MKHYLHIVLQTFEAPSSNYRGESENNRTVIQKLSRLKDDGDIVSLPYVSSTSYRAALRVGLENEGGLVNRERVISNGPPTVKYNNLPDPNKYDDDLIHGYLVVNKAAKSKLETPISRHSIIGVTHAVALSPYLSDATLQQSPEPSKDSAYANAQSASLLNVETALTAYQLSLSLCVEDFGANDISYLDGDGTKVYKQDSRPEALKRLLTVIGDPPKVSGNHARTLFSFEPQSMVVRCTSLRNPQFARLDHMTKIFDRLNPNDLPPNEFWFSGEIARANKEQLLSKGVPANQLHDNPTKMLEGLFEHTKAWIS